MTSVLLTAFEPYNRWQQNASWLTLVELTRDLPLEPKVTTRLYPVELEVLRDRVAHDLTQGYDYVIHTGQAPGRTRIELETIALNRVADDQASELMPLVADGPLALESPLPARQMCDELRMANIPAAVSHHAGTYLCNAAFYLSLHAIERQSLRTQAIFVHVPLDPRQTSQLQEPMACLPAEYGARAIRLLLESLPPALTTDDLV